MPLIHSLKSLRLILAPMLAIIAVLTLSRLGLTLWQFGRVNDTGNFSFIFIQGLRFDLIMLAMILIIPASLTPLFTTRISLFNFWKKFFVIYITAWFTFIIFMELSTPSFINQYDSRPNHIFVEYLNHYKEVSSTLLAQYPLQLLIAAILIPLSTRYFFRFMHKQWRLEHPTRILPSLLLVPALFFSFVALGRSSLDHRAAGPATVYLTQDSMVNELPLNSAYTVLYSIYLANFEAEGGFKFGHMPAEQAIKIVKAETGFPESAFINPALPMLHKQQATVTRARPLNLVIVLEESLGAEFVGRLGGLPLTPNLDKLGDEGLWFENLYATGTRSIRGIEAVSAGFPPLPAGGVVKLNNSQKDFFTIAQALKEQGYDTGFIYGGDANFDNMRRFFMSNGFKHVTDQNDYPNPVFRGSWGVSDEDLFNKAHEQFLQQGDKPFFSLVFTSSNHSPFQFPDGRIELYEPEKNTVNNAVKYADYALGQFIAQARKAPYWNNTLFLIVADHNSRVYGNSLVPIERFHIPALVLGADIKPEKYTNIASQIDLDPTILSLLGVSTINPMPGRDLTRAEARALPGRAIMLFNTLQAYMESDRVVILQKDLAPKSFFYRDGKLTETEQFNELVDKALAYPTFAQTAYTERQYRLR
ncbi:MAG: sulfatase-like hydrolase/transferase [Gammaproteobacteria bacterium]|nr:sulfatase-like hydrolase/transferase [Gammaproteobacteria bacterium]